MCAGVISESDLGAYSFVLIRHNKNESLNRCQYLIQCFLKKTVVWVSKKFQFAIDCFSDVNFFWEKSSELAILVLVFLSKIVSINLSFPSKTSSALTDSTRESMCWTVELLGRNVQEAFYEQSSLVSLVFFH